MTLRGEVDQLTRLLVEWLFSSGLRIIFILVGALLVRRMLTGLVKRIRHLVPVRGRVSEHEKRIATITTLLRTVITLGVMVVAASMILREFGVTIGPILASAGIVGLAVGFGAQNLVRDVVSGFFMLLENQIREGDVIRAAGVEGTVETFGLRATVLRDYEGNVHHVPNGEIKVVTNLTQDWCRAVIDIDVAYGSDLDQVMKILEGIGAELRVAPEWRDQVLECEVLGVERLGESAAVVRAAVRTVPEERLSVAREFRRRVLIAFDRAGIEIPFPHRTITIDEVHDGRVEIGAAPDGIRTPSWQDKNTS